ncbi:MAG TPA: A24 family peptidase [Candidatus Saccharimonadales bacterium]
MTVLVLVVLGLLFGSFVNALVWRVHEREQILEHAAKRAKDKAPELTAKEKQTLRGLSMTRGRSMCPNCYHPLAPKDLIPVVSWLALRGRCRYCHKKFDDTPVAELLTPLLFVVSYIWWPFALHGSGTFLFGLWLVFGVGFVALTLYDARWFILPDRIVFPLLALAVAQVAVLATYYHEGWAAVVGAAAGMLIISGLFYLLFMLSNGTWIGGGDVKLGAVLGILAGGPMHSVLLLFVASFAGLVFTIPQLVTGKAGRRAQVPFGPFLILALVIVQLFGSSMVGWYERLLA